MLFADGVLLFDTNLMLLVLTSSITSVNDHLVEGTHSHHRGDFHKAPSAPFSYARPRNAGEKPALL